MINTVTLEVNIMTKGVASPCGIHMLEGYVPPYSATVAERLETHGFAISGKTDIPGFGVGTPGGAYCLTPTYGRVSRYGVAGFSSSFDRVSITADTPADCGLILDAVSGYDPMDMTSARREYSLTRVMPRKGVVGEIGQACEETEASDIFRHAEAAYMVIACAEASANLAKLDGVKYGKRTENAASYDDLVKLSRAEGFDWELKKQLLLGTFVLCADNYAAYYEKAWDIVKAVRKNIGALLDNCDALYCPAFIAEITNLPAVRLPDGRKLLGKAFDEESLLSIAEGMRE